MAQLSGNKTLCQWEPNTIRTYLVRVAGKLLTGNNQLRVRAPADPFIHRNGMTGLSWGCQLSIKPKLSGVKRFWLKVMIHWQNTYCLELREYQRFPLFMAGIWMPGSVDRKRACKVAVETSVTMKIIWLLGIKIMAYRI